MRRFLLILVSAKSNRSFYRLATTSAAICAAITIIDSASAQSFTKSSTPWPEFPDPPKSKVEWVSNDMRVNGLPMKVLAFESQVSKAEVMSYYQALWDKYDPSLGVPIQAKARYAIVSSVGPDTVVGKVHGPYYMSVKIKDTSFSTSKGTMTTSLIVGVTPEVNPKGVPAPSNAKPISVVESADFGKQSKQVLFVSQNSIGSIRSFYEQSLPRDGWSLLDSHGDGRKIDGMSGYILTYVRKQQQLDLIIGNDAKKNATVINANLISF
jgi:hypothetical protein